MKRLSLLIVIPLTLLMVASAHANGSNQVIFLAYMPEMSNFGNKSASGIAVVDLHTGEVSAQTTSLTPVSDEEYHVWLAGPNLSSPVHIAPLEADGHLPTVIVELPGQDYRHVVLSVEAEGSTPIELSDKISLVGVFPNPEAVAPLAGVGSSGQPVVSEPPQEKLPNTGAFLPDRWVRTGSVALAAIGFLIVAAFQIKRNGGAK